MSHGFFNRHDRSSYLGNTQIMRLIYKGLRVQGSPDQRGSVGRASSHKEKGSSVPVRAHTWVAGSVPRQVWNEKQPVDVSLSHQCFSTSLSLSLKEK